MRPKPRARMPSMTALDMLKQEARFVWITAFHCSKLIRCIVASRVMPGIVDQDLDRAECASIAFTPSAQALKSATSNLNTGNAGLRIEPLCGFLVAGVSRRNLVAGILQRDRDRAADAARPAGHHRHPAMRPSLCGLT